MSDDYMSDEILRLAQDVDKKSGTNKRNRMANSQHSQPLSKKRIQELMEEKTNEGMNTAISSTNKGYKLLQKFGYSEGGLGKNNSGIENPLKIAKRENTDRSGLGVENDNRRLQQKIAEKKSDFLRDSDLEAGFLAGIKHKQRCRQMKGEIRSCETAIENLDTRSGIERHNLWPPSSTSEENEDHNVDDLEEKDRSDRNERSQHSTTATTYDQIQTQQESYLHELERLHLCIQYLRSTYLYCVYCGNDHENWEDMEENCPGPLKDDHD